MKLNKTDREILLNMGVPQKDFAQIERAASPRNTICSIRGKVINQTEAIRILGRKEYLSGLARSAFHYTCIRNAPDGTPVFFDSKNLFREEPAK